MQNTIGTFLIPRLYTLPLDKLGAVQKDLINHAKDNGIKKETTPRNTEIIKLLTSLILRERVSAPIHNIFNERYKVYI